MIGERAETSALDFVPPEDAPDNGAAAAEFVPDGLDDGLAAEGATGLVAHVLSGVPEGWVTMPFRPRAIELTKLLRRYRVPMRFAPAGGRLVDLGEYDEYDDGVAFLPAQGRLEFRWKGEPYVLLGNLAYDHVYDPGDAQVFHLAAPSLDALRKIVNDLRRYEPGLQGRILVFRDRWIVDHEIRPQIAHLGWNDLILPEALKTDIRSGAEGFFAGGGEVYQRLGIPYKRGFLLVGDPGCGKSLTVKILANTLDVPFIYVVAFEGAEHYAADAIEIVFERARRLAPCVLCFEDLDGLLRESLRSNFLNAMDGFRANDGVLVVATTNHPERIDPALLDRPSRFDRKFVFPNPDEAQRAAYLDDRLRRVLGVDEIPPDVAAALHDAALRSRRFSYAMLQELVVTAGVSHLRDGVPMPTALAEATDRTVEQTKLGEASQIRREIGGEEALGFRRLG